MRQLLPLLAVIVVMPPTAGGAQENRGVGPDDRGCLVGKPLPTCRSFALLEAGFHLRGVGPERFPYFTLEAGMAHNVAASWALGGTVFAGLGNGAGLGIKPRLRRWVGAIGLDLSPAVLLLSNRGPVPVWIVQGGVSYRDLVSFVIQGEWEEDRVGAWDRTLFLGVKLGLGTGVLTGLTGRERRCVRTPAGVICDEPPRI